MQNDFSPDSPLTISEATAACPKLRGKKLHVSTLWRWMRRGCKARNGQTIRLEHRRVGGTLTTTRADLERFFCALAAADLESFKAHDAAPLQALRTVAAPPKPFSDSVRRAQIERARRVLDEAGI